MKLFTIQLFFLVFITIPLFSSQTEFISKELEYDQLAKNMDFWVNSPLVLQEEILFYYKGYARKILIAGDFNNWKPEFLMQLKDTNFWQFSWSDRLKKGSYRYKLVIDDIWTFDPYNTNFIMDESGQKLSVLKLEEDFIPHIKFPLWLDKDIYLFKYEDKHAKTISLVGNFNNWNPYSHPLVNKGGGEFEIKMRLKPGLYMYSFVIDGDWKADYNNLNQYRDSVGNIVSILYVKENRK